MGTEKNEKSEPPQVVTLDKAFKLAERWVNNMTRVADEESEKKEPEPESRPLRLGLGAKVSRQFKLGPSADPVEKKLFYNLQAKKRREAQENEETAAANGDGDSDSEDDTGSRTAAFGKKRVPPPAVSLPTKKKKK